MDMDPALQRLDGSIGSDEDDLLVTVGVNEQLSVVSVQSDHKGYHFGKLVRRRLLKLIKDIPPDELSAVTGHIREKLSDYVASRTLDFKTNLSNLNRLLVETSYISDRRVFKEIVGIVGGMLENFQQFSLKERKEQSQAFHILFQTIESRLNLFDVTALDRFYLAVFQEQIQFFKRLIREIAL